MLCYSVLQATCGCIYGSNNYGMAWYGMVWYTARLIEYRPGSRWRDLTRLLPGVVRRILTDGTQKTSSP